MSKDESIPGALDFLLYETFRIRDLDSFTGFSRSDMGALRSAWTRDRISATTRALEWAVQHPDTDYSSVLPNLAYSNEQLYRYLLVLQRQFSRAEQEWFGESHPDPP